RTAPRPGPKPRPYPTNAATATMAVTPRTPLHASTTPRSPDGSDKTWPFCWTVTPSSGSIVATAEVVTLWSRPWRTVCALTGRGSIAGATTRVKGRRQRRRPRRWAPGRYERSGVGWRWASAEEFSPKHQWQSDDTVREVSSWLIRWAAAMEIRTEAVRRWGVG